MVLDSAEGCGPCRSRPRGERGHADLRELFRARRLACGRASLARYGCAACARIWERRLLAQGFMWLLVAAPAERVPVQEAVCQPPGRASS